MAESKLYTFRSLFGSIFQSKDYNNPEGVKLTEIEIPIIQRDYAQGRKSKGVEKVRHNFLQALYDAIIDKQSINLDFIYGDVTSHGKMIPLDGQQRLTTLFLLHWYVAKRERIAKNEYEFLRHFTYETRVSARQFFHELIDYDPDFQSETVSEQIEDQNWFPYEWKKDPTIVSALVMLDSIHRLFGPSIDRIQKESEGADGLWKRLGEGFISFYFLPIHEMGLTDDLYIKMNSRGKPLTLFEHFKAALEQHLRRFDVKAASRIIKKIDLEWTDMLWPYRGSNNIIDDEFMAYFAFISSVIYYRTWQRPETDPFKVMDDLFGADNEKRANNLAYFEEMFDIWCEVGNITEFFKRIYTKDRHEDGKITVFFPLNNVLGEVNPFLECCWNFGVLNGLGNRTFTLNKFLWLYAVTVYLRNKSVVSESDALRRLRIVNNLINASEFEIREDNMANILAQTDDIIINGRIDQERENVSYSRLQMKEEQDKLDWIENHPDDASLIYKLEDHPLLRGTISVIGFDNLQLCDKFYALFSDAVDRSLVNRALLTLGDYSQLFRWRYQLGAKADVSWTNLFHPSNNRQGFDKTHRILCGLLDQIDLADITNSTLQRRVDEYLAKETSYDWRYYMLKYPIMTMQPYGMFYWDDYKKSGNSRYDFIMMHTEKSISGRNWYAFLKVLYSICKSNHNELYLSDYAYNDAGRNLILPIQNGEYKIAVTQRGYDVKDADDNLLQQVPVSQNAEGLDTEDRVEIGIKLIDKLSSSKQLSIFPGY